MFINMYVCVSIYIYIYIYIYNLKHPETKQNTANS